jgi:transcriptional regulator with XRE-family HTH domain
MDNAMAAKETLNHRLARRIHALRTTRQLSLDGLAECCGVSRSMLSLIERGETSPTAVVLDKIATGLGVVLASLFDDPSVPASPIARGGERIPWRDPQSGYVRRNLSPPNFPSTVQLAEIMLPAGAYVSYETAARAPTIHQQVWVQEGEIEITIDKTTYRLAPDDCLAMQLDAPIAFRNPTRKKARYVVAIAAERPGAGQ